MGTSRSDAKGVSKASNLEACDPLGVRVGSTNNTFFFQYHILCSSICQDFWNYYCFIKNTCSSPNAKYIQNTNLFKFQIYVSLLTDYMEMGK